MSVVLFEFAWAATAEDTAAKTPAAKGPSASEAKKDVPATSAAGTRAPKTEPAACGASAGSSKNASGAAPVRASGKTATTTRVALKPAATSPERRMEAAETPIARALREIAQCQARYDRVTDYTCTLYKQERIAGRLTPVHIMDMKVRAKPHSIYLKFQQPTRGREAIYVAGKHGGRVLAHDVGITKLLAGTLKLDPTSALAMEDCRHPITEAGIGPLLETVAKRWSQELAPEHSIMTFHDDMQIGTVHCTMIESVHPERKPEFLHHKVRLYIDRESGLPVRFEAYDWPKQPGTEPELTEEYTYTHLKLNVGLHDSDFDTTNSAYSFGRF